MNKQSFNCSDLNTKAKLICEQGTYVTEKISYFRYSLYTISKDFYEVIVSPNDYRVIGITLICLNKVAEYYCPEIGKLNF